MLQFYKYQGTGNDFIMIDNRLETFPKNDQKLIEKLCDRKFGIGADGLILLENTSDADFKMIYFNADGNQSTMCGNGGRCIVAFAHKLGIIIDKTSFNAIDGVHYAEINNQIVSLQMQNVDSVKVSDDYIFLNTGSPHHIQLENNISELDVKKIGASIRYSNLYGKEGSNVNFVKQENENTFLIRTYERGVEDETLSCGTGATAAALAMYYTNKTTQTTINLITLGGKLTIEFTPTGKDKFENIFLIGEATFVFQGTIKL